VGGALVGAPFYRVGGGAGRSGIRGEQAAVVVHHNGDEGGHVGRGSVGVVVGSDEGGCSDRCGSGSGAGRRRAHVRWRQRQRVGPRRKTTRRGPCVSERASSWLG
jgi:hypothetical protein